MPDNGAFALLCSYGYYAEPGKATNEQREIYQRPVRKLTMDIRRGIGPANFGPLVIWKPQSSVSASWQRVSRLKWPVPTAAFVQARL